MASSALWPQNEGVVVVLLTEFMFHSKCYYGAIEEEYVPLLVHDLSVRFFPFCEQTPRTTQLILMEL